jgi:hypothetical protein
MVVNTDYVGAYLSQRRSLEGPARLRQKDGVPVLRASECVLEWLVFTRCQGKIRSRESAEYFLQWVERLRKEISDLSLWRSEGERARTFRELDEAARIYRERAKEAQ